MLYNKAVLWKSVMSLSIASLVLPAVSTPAHASPAQVRDVDGDGFSDVFVGAPEGVGGNGMRGGYVVVVPGGPDGAAPESGYQVDQSSAGVGGSPEVGDRFGAQVASADVDGDGFADLVVSAPAEDVREHEGAGLVQVVFGGPGGLSEESFSLHSPRQERGDTGFGTALAVGDIDGDGYGDVAISNGDHVTVLWGRSGLNGGGSDPAVSSFFATTSVDDEVSALELADVNGNGYLDLVVVSDHGRAGDGGELLLFSGSARGLSTDPVNDPISLTDQGAQVGAADINGDGHADVVITHADGEAARILAGSPQGLTGQGLTLDAGLGSDAVAVGDIDGDGYADIVLGDTTVEDPEGGADAGGVEVLYGGPDWLDGREQSFVQGEDGVAGASEAGDRMGAAVTLVDLNGSGLLDLVVGVPGEDEGNGAITVLYADGSGLSGTGSQTFGGATMGIDGSGAEFGYDLS